MQCESGAEVIIRLDRSMTEMITSLRRCNGSKSGTIQYSQHTSEHVDEACGSSIFWRYIMTFASPIDVLSGAALS